MAIEGPLRELGIHDVFQLLDLTRKTGVLVVHSELRGNVGTVVFEHGAVIGARLEHNPHKLGEALVRKGRISPEDLARATAMQAGGDTRRLGDLLVELGAISRRDLERQVQGQLEDVLFDLMSWSDGYFSFEEGAADPAYVEANVRVPTEALLMEAARRTDEWSRLELQIPHLGLVPRLGAAAAEEGRLLNLTPPEWELLAAVDGTRDLKALAAALGQSDFEAARTVYALLSAGILELGEPLRATEGPSHADVVAPALERVRERLASADAAGAVRAGEEAAAAYPDAPAVMRMYGLALAAAGRFDHAVLMFQHWKQMPDRAADEVAVEPLVERWIAAAATLGEALREVRA